MSNREWQNMSDKQLETLLTDAVSEIPPDEEVVASVTPWKKSMKRVLIGMALTTVTWNFLYLNYILPAIGILLLILGFRALRHENKWFGSCFVLTLIRAAYFFPLLIFNTTIIRNITDVSAIETVLTIVNITLILAEFLCLRGGITAVQKKAEMTAHAGGAVAMIVWYGLMCLLALFQYSGLIIGLLMIAVYFFILHSLYKLSKEIDDAGYAIKTAPIKITDRCIVIGIVAFLAVGCVCGYRFGGSYPMKWTAQSADEHRGVSEIKSQLSALGFPEYVLDDLSAEDIMACSGASEVIVHVTDEPFNDGRIETAERQSEDGHLTVFHKTVYDVRELQITGIGVKISGERERWIIFHHFLWNDDTKFYGTEAIQLWPMYRNISNAWRSDGDVTGRVLYDKDGVTFVSDYYSLGEKTYTSDSIISGKQNATDVFAAFSMPRSGKRCRGYVTYSAAEIKDGYIISSWFNYTHQQSPIQYPVVTAAEKRITTAWNNAGAFKTVQVALQFYPTDEDAKPID